MVSTRARGRASPSSPRPVSSEARGGSQGRKHPGSGKSNLPDSTPLARKLIRLQNGASWSPLNTRMEPTASSENDAMISISNSVKVPGRLLGPDSSVSTACRCPAPKLSRHILRRPRATGRGCGPASHRTAAVGRRHGHSEARGSAGGRTWASPTGTVQERSVEATAASRAAVPRPGGASPRCSRVLGWPGGDVLRLAGSQTGLCATSGGGSPAVALVGVTTCPTQCARGKAHRTRQAADSDAPRPAFSAGGRLSTAALTPQGANGHGAPGPPETPETEVRLSLGIRSSRLKFQVQLLKFASM